MRISEEVEGYLGRRTSNAFPADVKSNFKKYRYFAVSPIGSDPGDERYLEQGPSPIRVEDPMLWLLSETSSLVKVNRK